MDYEPIARLGRGGMGTVDLAQDAQGNKVALKRLTLHGSASEIMQARQRLLREAKVLRRLQHPNSVRLLDVVEDDDEIVLVMSYLPGGNLAERVAQHGPAPPQEVERLAQRLLGALAEAHAAGVIHRDIKPANVLYDAGGEPHLADFGLAHTWDQSQPLTVAGMVVGTPGFIAPEQARGEPLTPASDIFSLGATLLFAATGGGPFGNGDPGLLMVRAADGRVERVPKRLPAPLRRRLGRMLDPRPERRPTAGALLSTNGPWAPGWRRRPRGLAVVGAVAGTVLVATLAVVTTRDGDDDSAERQPDSDGEVGPTTSEPPSGEATTPPSNTCDPATEDCEGSATEDPDDNRDLVEEMQGSIDLPEDVDTYRVPLGERPGTACPRVVALRLNVDGGPGSSLVLEVYEDGVPQEPQTASSDEPAEIQHSPTNCRDHEVEVRVRSSGFRGPQEYTLTRTDR